MDKIANNTYQAHCTLIQDEATQIKYHLKIVCNDIWYTSNITFIPLAVEAKNNTTEDPNNPTSTPGFEMPLLVLSIALLLIFNQWRRKSGGKI